MNIIRRSLFLLAALAMLVMCACVAMVHYEAGSGIPKASIETADDHEIVGVAISGGGSRASVYGAAGLEALWEHGLLDRVDYISSVSGGSIASSYYMKKRFGDGEGIDAEFFSRFKEQMRSDLWSSIEWRQFRKFRWLSGTRRAMSLKEVLDARYLDGFTLGELNGSSPHLLINTTLYDNGRTLVITRLGQDEIEYDFELAHGTVKTLAEYNAVQPLTFANDEILGFVPGEMPLSMAVAASASLPFVLGPVSVHVGSRYWHLGDGGMFDNTGEATLVQTVLGRLQDRDTPGSAVILVLDSGRRPDEEALTRERNFHVAGHPERVFEIPSFRAEAYHAVVWSALRNEQNMHEIEKMVMLYTEVRLDPKLLPDSCESEPVLCRDDVCGDALQDHIRHIPTHLKISECDADIMELLAHIAVHEKLDGKYQRVRDCSMSISQGRGDSATRR